MTKEFWSGRRVFITGQTGFKGAWLAFWLAELGAEVFGLALPPNTTPNLHDLVDLSARGRFIHADIKDRPALHSLMREARPEIVIHMAAQALVRRSYITPVETFATKRRRNCNLARRRSPLSRDKSGGDRDQRQGLR